MEWAARMPLKLPSLKLEALRNFLQAKLPFASDAGTKDTPWWFIFHGDSRQALKELPADSVDCVVTSPPYYWLRDYGADGQIGVEQTIDEYVENITAVFRDVKRCLKPTGTLFLNIGDTYYSAKGEPKGKDRKHIARRLGLRAVDGPGLGVPRKSQIGIPMRVALSLQKDGWTIRSTIIWIKANPTPEPTAHDRPMRTYEFIYLFTKRPKYYFNRNGLAGREDIWVIEPDRNGASRGRHYAPFPRQLVEKCLECGCPLGGVVLEPFLGGGTTMSVALERGNPVIGIELNESYCRHVASVLRNLLKKKAKE